MRSKYLLPTMKSTQEQVTISANSATAHYRSIGSIDSEASLSSCSVSDQECDVRHIISHPSRRAFSVSSTTSSGSLLSNADNDRRFYHRIFRRLNTGTYKTESYSVNQNLGMVSTIGVRIEVESSRATEFSLDRMLQSVSLPFSAHRDEPSLSLVNKSHSRMIQLLRGAIDEQRVNFHSGTAFFKHIFDASVAQLWVKVKFGSRDKSTQVNEWCYFFLEDFHSALVESRRMSQATPYDIQMLKWAQKRAPLQTDARPYPSMSATQINDILRNFREPEFENQSRQQQTVLNLFAFLAPLFALEIVDLCFVLRYDSNACDFTTSINSAIPEMTTKEDDTERSSSVTSGCSSWVPSEDDKLVLGSDCDSKEETKDDEDEEPKKTKSIKSVLTFSNVRAMKRFRLKTSRDSPPQRPHSAIIVTDKKSSIKPLKSFVSVDNLNPSNALSVSATSLAFCRKLLRKTRSVLSVDRIDGSVNEHPSPVVSSTRCSTSSVGSVINTRLFGADLDSRVPQSILNLIKAFVLSQGLVTQGIFRKSANARNCRELRKLLEDFEETTADTTDLFDDSISGDKSEEELMARLKEFSVHEMASTLKEFVRQLPSGAIAPSSEFDRLRVIADRIVKFEHDSKDASDEIVDELKHLLSDNCNVSLLPILLSLLYQVSCTEENVKQNLMSPNNLAVCIGPSLISAALPSAPHTIEAPKSTSKLLSKSTTSLRDLFSSKSTSHHNSTACLSSLTPGLEPERISALVIFLIAHCNELFGDGTTEHIFKLLKINDTKETGEDDDNYVNEDLEDEVFFDDIITQYGPRNSATLKASDFEQIRPLSAMTTSSLNSDECFESETNLSDRTVRSLFRSNYESFHKYYSVFEQKRTQLKEKLREESKHPLALDADEDEEEAVETDLTTTIIAEDQIDTPTNTLATADYRAEFGRYVAKDSKIRLRKFRTAGNLAEPRQAISESSEPVTGLRMRELQSDDDNSPPTTPSAPQTLSRFFVTATVEPKPQSSLCKNPIRGLFRKNRQRYSLGCADSKSTYL